MIYIDQIRQRDSEPDAWRVTRENDGQSERRYSFEGALVAAWEMGGGKIHIRYALGLDVAIDLIGMTGGAPKLRRA